MEVPRSVSNSTINGHQSAPAACYYQILWGQAYAHFYNQSLTTFTSQLFIGTHMWIWQYGQVEHELAEAMHRFFVSFTTVSFARYETEVKRYQHDVNPFVY